jgi:LysR family carnitine catabolism transcriptional activator
MNISLRQLRAFVTLAGCKSFAEASELLHLSQPALSVSIKNMEQAAGGRLFSRSTRSMELSPEGRDFLPTARRLLADWEQAFDDLGRAFSLQQGKVSIAVMPSFAMNQFPTALLAFRKQYPDINVTIEDVVMESVIDAVREGHVDLGITFEPEQLDGVAFQPLFKDRFIAVVAGSSSLASKDKLDWPTLARQPFIAMNRGSWSRTATDRAMQEAGVTPRKLSEANQLATIGRMVSLDLGVSVVPSLCRGQMEAMGIICKSISKPAIERRVGIFTRKRHPMSLPAEAIMAILQQHFGKHH